ncbi:hypothetical protein [Streptomyces sp. NPDC086787]|uniref:hypothetical protein n=1 Tax=Streptomyces sp. NPDC086787 TaxID=3365759 RepID=UPI0038078C91
MQPGDILTVNARRYQIGYGDSVRSSVFTADGKFRMMDPLVTTTVVIACDARPGVYPVLLRSAGTVGPEEHPRRWARLRVAPADDAARRACRDKVSKLPPPAQEERWARATPGPSPSGTYAPSAPAAASRSTTTTTRERTARSPSPPAPSPTTPSCAARRSS